MTPNGHHRASLQLFRALHRATGADPVALPLLERLARATPDHAAPFAMAHDAYLAASEDGLRWGFTVNDRFHADFDGLLRDMAALAGGIPNLIELVGEVRAQLRPELRLTLGAGFDLPGRAPRLKIYLQEDRWNAGVTTVGQLQPVLAAIGIETPMPNWLAAERLVGVVTLEFAAGASGRAKVYVGGQTPSEAAQGAPDELQALARRMQACCPSPGFYYATVRLYPGHTPQTAINKIYAVAAMGYGRNQALTAEALRDTAALFRSAGRLPAYKQLLHELKALPGVHTIPTATALEDGGRSADCYVAAFPA